MKYYKIIILFLLIFVVNVSFSQNDSLLKRFIQISGNISVPTDYNKGFTACSIYNSPDCDNLYEYQHKLGGNFTFSFLQQVSKHFYLIGGINISLVTLHETAKNNPDSIYYLCNNQNTDNCIYDATYYSFNMGIILGTEYRINSRNSLYGYYTLFFRDYDYDIKTFFSGKKLKSNSHYSYSLFVSSALNLGYSYRIAKNLNIYTDVKIQASIFIGLGLRYNIKLKK